MIRDLKQKFESDGYVVLQDFLTEDEVNLLKAELDTLLKDMPEQENRTVFSTVNKEQAKSKYFLDSADKISYFFEADALGPNGELLIPKEKSLNKVGHALHELNKNFRKITFDERVKESCFQLDFQEPVVVQSMIIFKNPGVGSEVVMHQDASYLYAEPLKLVGFWIALEDATVENGCLWIAQGSHRSGVHRRLTRNPDKNSNEFLIYDKPAPIYSTSSFKPVPVTKGTCILIHGQVVHYSPANKSADSRHAYTFHVLEEKDTKYSKDNWLQLPEGKSFLNVYKTF
ncbi:phytanoyl-CoA dioxygenase domain-containing protein 1 homolog isoform X1 [Agrilus planipennis]|uniref:Phytanoyl-CoA dioxygenase domain-containing protein 1 homolog isoform X1 n=1 Tax=Agrilus planipennis TaxID=224129 RepID=A0A1W4X4B6_AGRPL|nr:phytanoyl-CoA dioxygenase domain-containing protein 1 homolog isoform X1 [Agrilus planipennis]